jgi:beta-glucosidase
MTLRLSLIAPRHVLRVLVGLAAIASLLVGTIVKFGAVGARPLVHSARASGCPWLDSTQTPDTRAHELLAAMTLDDKIQMVHGNRRAFSAYGVAGGISANPNLCIPDLTLNDAGQGIGDGQTSTVAFPAPLAQAASWDTATQYALGQAMAREARIKGVNIWLAPDVNIARVPMNGRNFEAFGEDPYLIGQTVAAEINGAQSQHVIATVKHYAANNQETKRSTISADVDERALHELELPGFEAAVKQGHVGSVMCAYNLVNSIYSCEQPTLLTNVLKHEYGFNGFVVSDWGATHSTVAAAKAGLDMEMPGSKYFGAPLQTAVQAGQVSMSRLNDMVLRILRSLFRIGVFDYPVAAEPGAFSANAESSQDITLARQASEQGTVLLKNLGSVLPLTGTGQRIAVIGLPAGSSGAQTVFNGGGSAHVPISGTKNDVVSPLDGIQQRALANSDTVSYTDGSNTTDAAAAASAADVAIVFAGQKDSEGIDRSNLDLQNSSCTPTSCVNAPGDPNQLIAQVSTANPNTIVILQTGGPVLMPWVDQVKGVVETWNPGQEDGNAIAAILFGDVNPSGKLPQTFPQAQSDLPTQTAQQYPGVNGHAIYSEGLDIGYRWYDAKSIQPLFPFGFGLSYTTFGYSGLSVVPGTGNAVKVTFTVTNTGQRTGAEVAQVYVGDPSAAGEPPQQLKGFKKVTLLAGKHQTVAVTLNPRSFAYWSTAQHTWVVAPGDYQILIGSSSRDIRLQGSVTIPAQTLAP